MPRVVATPLCTVKGCPWPRDPDQHIPWCGHGVAGEHQHWPKRSQGGKRIVAFLCHDCHDQIDNGSWGNAVVTTLEDGKKIEIYRAWNLHNETIIERIIGINGGLSAAAEAGEVAGDKPNATFGKTSAAAPSAKEENDGEHQDSARDSESLPSGETRGDTAKESRADIRVGVDNGDGDGAAAGSPTAHPVRLEEESDVSGAHSGDSGRDIAGAAKLQRNAAVDVLGRDSPIDSKRGDGGDNPHPLTHEQRVAIAQQIRDAQQRRQFLAGDTANAWEEELNEEFWNLYANEFGYTYPSVRNVMRVCKSIPPHQRHVEMSFAHHEAVKAFDSETREAWLERAFDEEWPVKRLREELVAEGLLKTKPRVKRWALEELRTDWARYWLARDLKDVKWDKDSLINIAFSTFLKWLEAEEQG